MSFFHRNKEDEEIYSYMFAKGHSQVIIFLSLKISFLSLSLSNHQPLLLLLFLIFVHSLTRMRFSYHFVYGFIA